MEKSRNPTDLEYLTKVNFCDSLSIAFSVEQNWRDAVDIDNLSTWTDSILLRRPWNSYFEVGGLAVFDSWEEIVTELLLRVSAIR